MCAFFDVSGEGRDSRVKSHACLSFKAIKWQTVPTMATTQVPVLRERDRTTLEWPKLYSLSSGKWLWRRRSVSEDRIFCDSNNCLIRKRVTAGIRSPSLSSMELQDFYHQNVFLREMNMFCRWARISPHKFPSRFRGWICNAEMSTVVTWERETLQLLKSPNANRVSICSLLMRTERSVLGTECKTI